MLLVFFSKTMVYHVSSARDAGGAHAFSLYILVVTDGYQHVLPRGMLTRNSVMRKSTIQYHFELPDGNEEIFDLILDATRIELLDNIPAHLPPWTALDFHQCPHCTLSIDQHPHCPLAANLVNIVSRFNRFVSYDTLGVKVIIGSKTISQTTTVQAGVSSMMGLIIATCGCPHTLFFKPMACFHLPMASEEETVYRATSMYLLAQYFIARQGGTFEQDFSGLMEIYSNIHTVNVATAARLRAASETDSSVNAIIILDMFAKALPYAIKESLEEIGHLFAPFIEKRRGSS